VRLESGLVTAALSRSRPGPHGRGRCQRCSGLSASRRQPASHSERWLPWAGTPPDRFNSAPRCSRFQVAKVVLRLVKSFSGPPEPGSRYDGPGPAAPIQPASAWGGIV
jgi:hypothetical protein